MKIDEIRGEMKCFAKALEGLRETVCFAHMGAPEKQLDKRLQKYSENIISHYKDLDSIIFPEATRIVELAKELSRISE